MNIVLATDNKFVQHCSVAMMSILQNNTDVHFYILTEGLNDSNQRILEKMASKQNAKLTFCMVDSNIVRKFPMPIDAGDHISMATYYRIFIDKLLPRTIDEALYLDCDIVVRGSLSPLFQTDMKNYALGAVYQSYNSGVEVYSRLNIPIKCGYFNAGVLLINLDYWRKYDVSSRLLNYLSNNYSSIKQHDQDVLNAVLYKETIPISNIWNYLPIFFFKEIQHFPSKVNYACCLKDPVIVHYVSTPKPWEYGSSHPFKQDYYKYLDLTSFKGWRPSFIFDIYYAHILKPALVKIFITIDFLNVRKLLFKLPMLCKR